LGWCLLIFKIKEMDWVVSYLNVSDENKLNQLRRDLQNLISESEFEFDVIQLPWLRAHEITAMNAEELCQGGIPDWQIDDLLTKITSNGIHALNGLIFNGVRVVVAELIEKDCSELKIVI
jgi:hypothetical protein